MSKKKDTIKQLMIKLKVAISLTEKVADEILDDMSEIKSLNSRLVRLLKTRKRKQIDMVKKDLRRKARRLGVSVEQGIEDTSLIKDIESEYTHAKKEVKTIDAKGVKVISPTADIANARITFKNGCVANITASRISAKKERKFRIFMPNLYASLNYAQQTIEIYQKINNSIESKILDLAKEEPLKKEIIEFVNMVKKKDFSIEYALKAKEALDLALKIQKIINQ